MKDDKVSYPRFSGNPKLYRKIAYIGSFILNLYLYLGMMALVYGLNNQTWILGWKPAVIAVVFALVFGRLMNKWMMRLDAQYGSGRGWKLEGQMIKLPERVIGK